MKNAIRTVQRFWSFALLVPPVVALALLAYNNTASSVTMYGTLSNFDVINDTGQPCHGFEIELDGLSSADVTYTFGAPYERYGDPTVVDDPANNRVFVRYTSSYDSNTNQWAATTPLAPSPPLPTLGHDCWNGSGIGDYFTSGCEHFGVSLIGNPTNTVYRWLVEVSPGVLGPLGTNVSLPAPVWNVTPPSMPAAPPVVMAAIAPPAPQAFEFGDALWVKIFVTESPNEIHPDDLVHLVLDDPADLVPHEPAEVEIEWQILQAGPKNCSTTNSQECLVDADCAPPACPACVAGETCTSGEQEFGGEVGAGNESVSRRFEFYKYIGDYDPETHEALCNDQPTCPEAVGDFIGAQNAAVNLGPVDPCFGQGDGTPCDDGNACTQSDTCQAGVCTGNPVTCTALDQCHEVGTCDSATGTCSNPPSPNTKSCDDHDACTQTDTCNGAGACTGSNAVTCTALDQCHEAGTCDSATGACSNPPSPNTKSCDDHDACTQTDTCNGAGACTGGNPVTCTALDQCHEAGACDSATGACSNPPSPNTKSCDDHDACTQTDTCNGAGACTGSNPVTCTALDQCHEAGTCDGATGACSNPPSPNTKSCDDHDACTQTDTCDGAGACTGSNPVTCSNGDQCNDPGTCSPATGECSAPVPKGSGSPCDDSNACTQGDACRNGVCVGTNICVTDKNQCKNGGWQSLIKVTGQPFKNQGDCVSYVNTGR